MHRFEIVYALVILFGIIGIMYMAYYIEYGF